MSLCLSCVYFSSACICRSLKFDVENWLIISLLCTIKSYKCAYDTPIVQSLQDKSKIILCFDFSFVKDESEEACVLVALQYFAIAFCHLHGKKGNHKVSNKRSKCTKTHFWQYSIRKGTLSKCSIPFQSIDHLVFDIDRPGVYLRRPTGFNATHPKGYE